jgi:hypothetical protein
MDPALLKIVQDAVEQGVRSSAVWSFLLVAVGSLIGAFVGSFLSEKGKNLATRQDIERITHLVELTKAEIQAQLTHKYVAMEKRLQAHQEAYALARRLRASVLAQTSVLGLLQEMDDWFDRNALYLEPAARDAFWSAYGAARLQPILDRRTEDFDIRTPDQNREIINTTPNKLLVAFGLTPLSEPLAEKT